MAWTAPKTFTAGSLLPETDLNTYLQNNMKESFAEKATAAHQYAVVSSANTLVARTIKAGTSVTTAQATSSTTFVDLATVGPTITSLATGTRALVIMTCAANNNTIGEEARMSVAVSGATTLAADNNYCVLSCDGPSASHYVQTSLAVVLVLTAGNNTFTAKYRSSTAGSSATFANRNLIVMPL